MKIETNTNIETVGVEPQSRITEMVIWKDGARQFLVSAYGGSGDFVSFELTSDGGAIQRDVFKIVDAPTQLLELDAAGGFISDSVGVADSESGVPISDCVVVDTDQGRFSYSISGRDAAISIERLVAEGESVAESTYEFDIPAVDDAPVLLRDLAMVEAGGQQWLIASASGAETVASFRIDANGELDQVDRVGTETGLGLHLPEVVIDATVGSSTMVLVGSSGSNSITVLRVTNLGHLVPTDHVGDNLSTRFADLSAMSTLEVDGTMLVFAGGSDGGISIFQLLPTGRLILLQTLTDTVETSLQGVSSIVASLDGDVIRVFVASQQEAGISSFEIRRQDLGLTYVVSEPGGEALGGAGDDRLVANAMEATLTGGAGEDQFVFEASYEDIGSLGTITDFEAGLDMISFPGLVLLRNISQLSINPYATGAVITYGDVTLDVLSADGSSLEATDFPSGTFFALDHYYVGNAPNVPSVNPEPPTEPEPPIVPAPPKGVNLQGTEGNDVLTGTAGDDTIRAGGGNDNVIAGDGNDKIYGGNGFDQLYGGNGDDVIFGGDGASDLRDEIYAGLGDDFIDSGYGNDLVYAGGGDDLVLGGFGSDMLIGQGGKDIIAGGPLSDLIFGGDGADFINGGFGHDRINGGAGGDSFYHLGILDHGSDWIQDYNSADGDVLVFADANASFDDFSVSIAETVGAGGVGVSEAFVVYHPTRQIIWALVDGGAQDEINLKIDGDVFNIG